MAWFLAGHREAEPLIGVDGVAAIAGLVLFLASVLIARARGPRTA
jgi:hypothetical protein